MKLPAAPQRFLSAAFFFQLLPTNPAPCLVSDLKSPLPNCHCQERKGATKGPGSATAVSTTAGVQDRMIIELVIPAIIPAQVEVCQKYFFWERFMLWPFLRFEGTEHRWCYVLWAYLFLPVSRGSCCCGHCSVPQGRLDLVSSSCREVLLLPKGSGLCSVLLWVFKTHKCKHSPNPSGTAVFFHVCMAETSTKPHWKWDNM